MKGIVKWFNSDKGWGFITCDEDFGDYFVHYSSIIMDGYKVLRDGQRVTFEKDETSEDRLKAKNVRVVQNIIEEQK